MDRTDNVTDSARPNTEFSDPIRILLVDDRPENLLVLEAVLERDSEQLGSFELIRATGGPEALRAVLHHDFAVILLDVQMPGMDGFETASLIRAKPGCEHTPIIFLTAVSTSDSNVFRGYSLGAVDYLFKPFEPEILRAKIGVFVELHRNKLEIQHMAEIAKEHARLLRESNDDRAKTNKLLGTLYHELEAKTEELRWLNESLELRIIERMRDLHEANDALRLAKESAEKANQAKDQLLAVLSHELRTPLTPVLAIVQVLRADPALSADVKAWVETIDRNIELEARLIDDLLDLTRISKDKLPLHLEVVDAHKAIQETVAMCMGGVQAKHLELTVALDAGTADVEADSARLKQVLWNLIKNAVKFTPENGRINIRTENSPSGAFCCHVSDSGIGISPENLEQVFNAFDQGDSSITRRFGGLGLGLAISKALVEQHGGRITASSAGIDHGATFTIEWPVWVEGSSSLNNLPEDGLPGRGLPEHGLTDKNHEPASPLSASPRTRILLVEDNLDASRALQALLERVGFIVIVAGSVHAALEIAKTYPYDILVSDIGLPDGDGIELFSKLNEIRPTRGIAISGFGMPEDIQRSLDAGFSTHLVKPLSFHDLNEALQHVMAEA